MNRSFKLIGRHPFNGRQVKKRIYTSREDYQKYYNETAKRYLTYLDVECYELINGKWLMFHSEKYPGGATWRRDYKY